MAEVKKMKKSQIKNMLKALGVGALFGFVAYIIGAEGSHSAVLGLLITYLHYKMK